MRTLALAVALCGCLATVDVPAAEATDSDKGKLLSGDEIQALILRDFVRFDPRYLEHRERLGRRLTYMAERLSAIQATGNGMECSNEIYLEANWLYHYTADWNRLERRLVELTKSLDQSDQDLASRQSPETGLWGACYEEPFFKVEATFVALIELEAMGETPHFPIHLPHPFDAPLVALEHVRALLVSDIAHTGVDNRAELGNLATVGSLAYFKDNLQDYLNNKVIGLPRNEGGPGKKTEEYRATFNRYIKAWQDPTSGYWGPWYRSDGHLYKGADLSFTFHIISYKGGDVGHWPKIIETTMAIEHGPYPFGWSHNGEMVNHNNYDVAKIFREGWSHMSLEQRHRGASAIADMLHWTLNSSLQENGSFKTVPTFFSSLGADFYFGVSFLQTIGFWDSSQRFWTKEDFPEAPAVCERIKARLVAMALKMHESRSALAHLENTC